MMTDLATDVLAGIPGIPGIPGTADAAQDCAPQDGPCADEKVLDAPKPRKRRTATPARAEKKQCVEGSHEDADDGASECKGMLIVNKTLREFVKTLPDGFNIGACFIDALNTWLCTQVVEAANRARANGRKTIKGHDVAGLFARRPRATTTAPPS